jgi:hypothetical protein
MLACSSNGSGPTARPGDSPASTDAGPTSVCGPRITKPPAPSEDPYCPPVEEMIAWLSRNPCPEEVIPSERELACRGALIPRRNFKASSVSTSLDWSSIPDRPDFDRSQPGLTATAAFKLVDDLAASGFPQDFVAISNRGGIPPYFNFKGPDGTLDFFTQRAEFEAGVRGYAAAVLRERAKGKPAIFHYDLGPHEHPVPKDVTQIEAMLRDVIVPRTEIVARIAEFIQAEALVPFAGEADIIANQPQVRTLPAAERVGLVQRLVVIAGETAKKYFSGKLIGLSAWSYYPPNDGFWSTAPMDQVSFKGFDVVLHTMLVGTSDHCTAEFSTNYVTTNVAKYDELAKRDSTSWGIGELDVFTFNSVKQVLPGQPCQNPREAFFPVWDATLAALVAGPSRPTVVSLVNGPSAWATDQEVQNGLKTKFVDFATKLTQ